MTKCAFFVIDVTGKSVELFAIDQLKSFQAAREVLRATYNANIDVIEAFNGYLAMLCQIYN